MSLYQVDKAIKLLTHNEDPAPFERFVQDPAAYAGNFELTDDERQALVSKDVGKLYSMGVQPFMLQMFAMKVSGERDMMAFYPKYIQTIAPYGNPDYET